MRLRGTTLRRWPEMPYPDERCISEFGNWLIYNELDYNPAELQYEYERLYVSLNTKQKSVYDIIMNSVETRQGGVYFVYGYGGTGKNFLWKTLAAGIRRNGDIVLNVASSGLTVGASPEDVCKIRDFTEWILKVEDRELGEANDGEVSIDVPEELLIDAVDDPVTSIIDFTYPNLLNNINNSSYFQEKGHSCSHK
nr:ATP-dependent DNA helicase PIF4 [Tanacetum cinerariifolium]GFA16090.1 ATP-dependent DNA helicase PIF4 [Tanacetum cinerariifolium]